jgi:hypothetical protein
MPGRPSLGLRKQILVRFPMNLVEEIDAARGHKPMNLWMEDAARLALRPTSQAVMPELLQEKHEHRLMPSRTEMAADGTVTRWKQCMDCDLELRS